MTDLPNQPTPPDGGGGHSPPAAPPGRRKPHVVVAVAVGVTVGLLCIGGAVFAVAVVGSEADKPAVTPSRPAAAAPTEAATEPAVPAEQPSDDGSGTTVHIGEGLSISGASEALYTLVRTEQRKVDKYGFRPDHGLYLLAYVTVKVTDGSQFVYDGKFALVTAAGKVYDPTGTEFKGRDGFTGADVAAGQTTDGWIAFDIPPAAAAHGGRIQLKVNEFDDLYGYWLL